MDIQDSIRFTKASQVSVGKVRAPACPIDTGATWVQILVAFPAVPLFGALAYAALTRDPASILGAALAIIGLASALFVFVGILKTRIESRSG